MENIEKDFDLLACSLAEYLPYGIIVEYKSTLYMVHGIKCIDLEWYVDLWGFDSKDEPIDNVHISEITPYLRAFADITDIEQKWIDSKNINDTSDFNSHYHAMVDVHTYLKFHLIDCFNLIEKKLAKDVNEIDNVDLKNYYDNADIEI